MIENSKKPIPVLVSGALGRMGSEVVNTVLNSTDCELVAAIYINEKNNGSNISELLKVKNCDVFVSNDFEGTLCCLLYTSPSPRDPKTSRMPSSA